VTLGISPERVQSAARVQTGRPPAGLPAANPARQLTASHFALGGSRAPSRYADGVLDISYVV